MAVIECEPAVSVEVMRVATPPDMVLVASGVAPSLKVTVPVGVPDPGATALTVAVKVTGWPNTEGVREVARAVVVLALLTVCVTVEEVLVL